LALGRNKSACYLNIIFARYGLYIFVYSLIKYPNHMN
jgi:hypothetical protein